MNDRANIWSTVLVQFTTEYALYIWFQKHSAKHILYSNIVKSLLHTI